ncbi:hypothetical protein SUDANB95_04944 [Actinosynnema sp. ALI-1.44]
MIARWCSTSSSRTSATADTGDTASVTSGPRISAPTSCPSSRVREASGSEVCVSFAARATSTTRSVSVGSTPARSTASVIARYIAPVSR